MVSQLNGPDCGFIAPSGTTVALFHVPAPETGPVVSRTYSSVLPVLVCRSRRFAISSGKSGFCADLPRDALRDGRHTVAGGDGPGRRVALLVGDGAGLAAQAACPEGGEGLGADERLGHRDRVRVALVVGLHARLLPLLRGRLRVAGGELRGLERAQSCVALVGLLDLRGDVVGALEQLGRVAVVVLILEQAQYLVALLGEGGGAALDGVDRSSVAAATDGPDAGEVAHRRCPLGPWTARSRPDVWVSAVRLSRPVDRARRARGFYVRCERPG
ncbi:hypothetical protein ACRJ4B_16095 [Streptomyces sp. GTA36]